MIVFCFGACWGINLVGLLLGRGQAWFHVVCIVGIPLLLAAHSREDSSTREGKAV